MQRLLAWAVVASLGGVTADALLGHGGHPETWALACLCLWAGFLVSRGPRRFTAWELRNVLWASASLVSFAFLLLDGDLNSWADVFYFCGEDMRYCTSDYRWNVRGWRKAVALWNFMLAGAMGLQRLVIVLGLNGLHPGEDVVTQESFVSIGWRLIPYWLNNWEQQWGAECSSMVFELPHFALELLVVLPCVQILCARLKILAQPHVAAALPPEDAQAEAAGEGPGDERDAPVWTPNILACRWERRRGQRRLLPRLKANLRAMSLTLFVCSLALLNALVMPLLLERSVVLDPRSAAVLAVERELHAVVSAGRYADLALWYGGGGGRRAPSELRREEHVRLPWMVPPPLAPLGIGAGLGPGGGAHEARDDSDARDPTGRAGRRGGRRSAAHAGAGAGADARPSRKESATPYAVDAVLRHLRALRAAGGVAGGGGPVRGGPRAGSAPRSPVALPAAAHARLGVWTTLFQPLLPLHWLQALQAAEAGALAGLDPATLCALQYAERDTSAALAAGLHALTNDPAAAAPALAAWDSLLAAGPAAATAPEGGAHGAAEPSEKGAGAAPARPVAGAGGGAGIAAAAAAAAAQPPPLPASLTALNLTQTLFLAARAGGLDVVAGPLRLRSASDARGDTTGDAQVGAADGMPGRAAGSTPAHPNETVAWLRERQGAYWARRLAEAGAHARRSPELRLVPLYRALHKHARELAHMRDQGHRRLFPLVELALCIMRLSCERFFTLLAVWAGYLAFRDPPAPARRAIVTVARLAAAFQRAVLLAFPAVCWVYDAGIVFSTFASIVFWSGPLRGAVEKVRSTAASVEPHGWRHATAAEVERMGGQCAVCWGTLGPEAAEVAEVSAPAAGGDTAGAEGANSEPGSPPGDERASEPAPRPARSWLSDRSAALRQAASAALSGRGPLDLRTEEEVDSAESAARWAAVDAMALPCGHAYHADCILQWLQQCFSQGRVPTCPMCQATIALRVRYHWPFRAVPRSRLHDEPVQPQFGVEGDGGLDPGIRGIRMLTHVLRDDFRNRFEVFLAPDQAQQPVGLEVPQPNDVRQPLWG